MSSHEPVNEAPMPSRIGPFRRLISNSGWLFASSTVRMVLGAIQGLLIARMLGVEQFGVFALITTFTAAVNQFVDSRVWETAIKYASKFRAEREFEKATALVKLCFLIDIVTATIGVLLIFIAADWAANVFIKDSGTASLVQVYSLSLLVAAPVGTSTALLRIADSFRWLAYRESGVAVMRLVSVLCILAAGFGIRGLVLVYLGIAIVDSLIVIAMVCSVYAGLELKSLRQTPVSAIKGEFWPILTFLFMSNGVAVTKLIQHHLGALLTGAWLGPAAVGYLRVAKRVCDLMMFPVGPIAVTTYPEFARLWHAGAIGDLKHVFWKLTRHLVGAAVLMTVGMFLTAHIIISWTTGEQYLPALPVLYWLAFGMLIQISFQCFPQLLRAIGRMGNALVANVACVTSYVIALVFLLPNLGLVGAGIAYVVLLLTWAAVSSTAVGFAFYGELCERRGLSTT